MISINKEEKTAIAERFPNVCIVRTMKGDSKRHHYYCEESPRVLNFLAALRGGGTQDRRGGGRYR